MAGLHLVTGYKGSAHVTSADQGIFNAMSVGTDDYVLKMGRRFEAQIISNNTVRIFDGSLVMNGRHVNLDSGSYIDATITNGTSGKNRHDIIVMRYSINRTSGVESVSLVVNKGAESTSTPTDPTATNTGSILNNADNHDMPLYRVVIEGLTIAKVEPLFQVLAPLADIQRGQNLLINGDFQCNQRGKTTYSATTKSAYSVDMWRIFQAKVDLVAGGVKVTGLSSTAQGYFTQFIQLGVLKTTTYTVSAKVNGKIYTYTETPAGTAKEKDFGTFKISMLTMSIYDNGSVQSNYYDNKLKINICPVGTSSITIEYVDVFEGTVAYPHVREDAGVAMARARRYIQKGCYVSPILYSSGTATNTIQHKFAICHDKLYSNTADNTPTKPILESYTWSYTDSSANSASGTVNTPVTEATSVDGMFMVSVSNNAPHSTCYGIKGTYLVTSEPFPNGEK